MADKLTQFDYLLNAMENAAASKKPAQSGYTEKRAAVLEYVRKLEAACATTDTLKPASAVSVEDAEFAALRAIAGTLTQLDKDAQSRVLRYAKDRFGIYFGEG